MLKLFFVILLLVALAVVLLSVRLFFGRKFVQTHIDGNEALNKQGIHCVKDMERLERMPNPHRVSEKSV